MNPSRLPKNSQEAETHDRAVEDNFWRAWRWWLAPALLALTLSLLFVDKFIGDWDGLDYTVLALRGEPSSMALGRMLFIYANHALYRAAHALFHLQPQHAYLLFKYVVVAQSPLAVIACWILAHDLTRRREAATVAALFVALSPVFVIYSGQVMTDVPSVLIVACALILYGRGVQKRSLAEMLSGALLLGAGVNVREPAAFFAPWLLIAPFVYGWKLGRREIFYLALVGVAFMLSAFGPFAYLFWTSANYRAAWHGWRETMNAEAARHPVTLRNLLPFLSFFFLTAPVLVTRFPLAAIKEWRERGLTPLLALALFGLCADLLLFFNYSTAINIRYFLTGLPALAPLVADHLMRAQTAKFADVKRAFWTIALSIAFITVLMGAYAYLMGTEYQQKRLLTKDYLSRLELVPRDAVMLAGAQTVGVTYWRGVGVGEWLTIGTGAGWPGSQLQATIENFLQSGRRVFLDVDPRWWQPCGWQQQEIFGLVQIESKFRFRRVAENLYEIRPLTDETAHDPPDLQRLLPENRPAETKKCKGFSK